MKRLINLNEGWCVLCGLNHEYLSYGIYHDDRLRRDLLCHMACAEQIHVLRLKYGVLHWPDGPDDVVQQYVAF